MGGPLLAPHWRRAVALLVAGRPAGGGSKAVADLVVSTSKPSSWLCCSTAWWKLLWRTECCLDLQTVELALLPILVLTNQHHDE